ncbi:ribosome-recycling factor [bacterium BMS3Abin05]|nr:ribosome-recycling factor [bacterium BMS3Abin05]GBE27694.1 ribosome-recycling factor [bacterium BMS3Bbin03]
MRMRKSLEAIQSEMAKIRTGKATTSLLDMIKVNYYGSQVPLKQVANITVPEPRLLSVQPWEKNLIPEIEKAILKSDLGLNPSNDGKTIRIPFPQLTEERRKELVKLVKKMAEEGRIAVRNIRRDVNEHIKKAQKNHELTEDQEHDELDEIQKLTDEYIEKIVKILAEKEKEIMEV